MVVAPGGHGGEQKSTEVWWVWREQQSTVVTSSLQAGAAAHRAKHRAWTPIAQKRHENGSGDPNHA